MARGRRGGRSGGGRGRRGDPPVAEPVAVPVGQDLDFAEPERYSRAGRGRGGGGGGTSTGGGAIGIVIPLIVTLLTAIMLIVTGFVVKSSADTAMDRVLEAAGINTVLALAVPEPDSWMDDDGVGDSPIAIMKEQKNIRIKQDKKKDPRWDDRNLQMIDNEFNDLLETWYFAEPDAGKSSAIRKSNQERLERLIDQNRMAGTTVIYASITKSVGQSDQVIRRSGDALGDAGVDERGGRRVGIVDVFPAFYGGRKAMFFVAPVKDRFGNAFGKAKLLVSAAPAEQAGSGMTSMIFIMALVGLLVVGGLSFLLCLSASGGVKRITRDLAQVAQGDLDVRIRATGGGEVGALARTADRAMKTFRAVQEQSIQAAAVQPIPVATGTTVDTGTLLPNEPPRIEGYEFESVHKPSPEGANDFFDYVPIDDQHVGIVIADMPHGGPSGAFIASTFRALMRGFALGEASPAVVLSKVNRVLASELKRGDHITAMYTVLNIEKGIIAVASAGHLPLVFWKLEKKGSALLNPEGIAIGLDKGPVFEKTVVDKRIKLERGDRIVLYTDGPVAAQNAEGEEFGEQRFYYVVSREAPKNSAAFVNFVANEVDLFHEGAVQQDDITLVTLRKL